MTGFLFDHVIFGPVRSRRLGLSLGVNLLPLDTKYCSFNCIYCECGWTPPRHEGLPEFPTRAGVATYLEQRLRELAADDYLPDAITYAGNGEPTLHPDFAGVVDDTIALRNRYAPKSKVSVLSNASRIHVPEVFDALLKLDNNILKLDAGSEELFNLINNPVEPVDFSSLVDHLTRFKGRLMIQSMFLRGKVKGNLLDNTTEEEVTRWIGHLERIRPASVMVYPIARATPLLGIEKIGRAELEKIADRVRGAGLQVQVYE